MKKWQKVFLFFGRIFISLSFILFAINKILSWQDSEKILTQKLGDWQSYLNSPFLQRFITFLLNWTPALLLLIILAKLLGGLLLFFGKKIRFSSLLLGAFLIFTTFIYHPFWLGEKEIQMVFFLKNMAIFGGLLYIIAYGDKKDVKKKLPTLQQASFIKNKK